MKENLVYVACLLALLVVGVWLARRWVVAPPPPIARYPRWLRIGALVLFSWVGTFVAHTFARQINSRLNDGIAFDEGAELPYEVMHDGVGDNVLCLLLGWSAGFLCWGIAATLKPKTNI